MKRRNPFKSLLVCRVRLNSDHLGGILSKLRNQTSDFLNLFTSESSTTYGGSPQSVFNPSDSSSWWTCNQNLPWIEIKMKNIYLTITGYILMSYDKSPSYPKSWYLSGRNSESESWQKIDEQSDVTELKGKKKVKEFKNKYLSPCTFKMFRLTLTADTYSGTNNPQLALNEMDFIEKTSFLNPKLMSIYRSIISSIEIPIIGSVIIILFISDEFCFKKVVSNIQLKSE